MNPAPLNGNQKLVLSKTAPHQNAWQKVPEPITPALTVKVKLNAAGWCQCRPRDLPFHLRIASGIP